MADTFPLKELRLLLEKAQAADADLKQFGAKNHKYQWNPPASLTDIEEFERESGITLPEGYRDFLLQAGDGGAGPFYGLFSLEQVRGWLGWPLEPEKPPVLRPGMSEAEGCGKENWKRGCIPIESEGDTFFTCLMVTGPDRGRVVYIEYEGYWVFFPREPDFLSWYTRWLRDTANGYKRIGWFATDLDGDEEELRRHYTEAGSKEERQLTLVSMKKFPELSAETQDFIREVLADWSGEPNTAGISELANQVDPVLYERFLEQQWNAGLYDQVLYAVYHTPGDKTALAERWRERILAKMLEVSPEYCGLVIPLLRRGGGVRFEQVVVLLDRVPEQQKREILRSLGRLPDAGEHLDFWLPLLEERENLESLHNTLLAIPQVNDPRLKDALLAVQEAFPYAMEPLYHSDLSDPVSREQFHRRCQEEKVWRAADSILKELFYEGINPIHRGIPRPWRLELDGNARADMDMHRKPPEGIPLHPLIALWILQKEGRLPSTAWDWNRKLEKLKKLELFLRDAVVKNWSDSDRIAWLRVPEEHAPPAPYYYDLQDWSAIGRMPHLHELRMAEMCVEDFSFLTQCKELRRLSLCNTNFTDCRLLLGLPKLKSVDLQKCHLTHTEVLEDLQGVSVDL